MDVKNVMCDFIHYALYYDIQNIFFQSWKNAANPYFIFFSVRF